MRNRNEAIMSNMPSGEEADALAVSARRRLRIIAIVTVVAVFSGIGFAAFSVFKPAPTAAAFFEKAKAYAREGNPRAVAIELRNVLGAQPAHVEARWMLAQLLLEHGDAQGALKELERAKTYGFAEEVEDFELKALALAGNHLSVLDRLKEIPNIEINAELLMLRGDSALAVDRVELAHASYRASMAAQPNNPEARKGLAKVHQLRGNYSDAKVEIEAILSQSPADLDAWLLRGDIDIALGALNESERAFARAREIDNDDPRARLGLARAYLMKGDAARAKP